MSDRIALWPIHEKRDWASRLPVELRDSAKCYTMGHARIIVSNDQQGDGSFLWHLSISCVDRDPTWQEIATARYRLLPEVAEMAMYLPPLDEYVNLHPFTFHLHEVRR
jgi:hypothetical protein